LHTAADVCAFLSRIAADLCAGRLEPKRANALCYIATSLLKAIDLSAQQSKTSRPLRESHPASFEAMMRKIRRSLQEAEAKPIGELEAEIVPPNNADEVAP